jgi:hypothetical protein
MTRGKFVRIVRRGPIDFKSRAANDDTDERMAQARQWLAVARGETSETAAADEACAERTLRILRRKPGSDSVASERHAQVNYETSQETEA